MQDELAFEVKRSEDKVEAKGQNQHVIADPSCKMFQRVAMRVGLGDLAPKGERRMLVVRKNGVSIYIADGTVIVTEKDLRI